MGFFGTWLCLPEFHNVTVKLESKLGYHPYPSMSTSWLDWPHQIVEFIVIIMNALELSLSVQTLPAIRVDMLM